MMRITVLSLKVFFIVTILSGCSHVATTFDFHDQVSAIRVSVVIILHKRHWLIILDSTIVVLVRLLNFVNYRRVMMVIEFKIQDLTLCFPARDYETRVIERFRRMYGDDALPGNKINR